MKTNKITKSIIVLLTVLILGSLSVSAYAKTNSDNAAETPAFKHGEKKHHQNEHKKDRFEDWFEHRIESREITVDFSQLPDNPTDEEMFEFFKNNFMGKNESQTGSGRPNRSKKDHRKADSFEDWFEDRIDAREHRVDFSELPEDPTDEEIVEFFRKNFMGKDNTGNLNEQKKDDSGKPSCGHKNRPPRPAKPVTDNTAETGTVSENPVVQPVDETTAVEQPVEEAPAEEKPVEEAPDKNQPTEETVKDKR